MESNIMKMIPQDMKALQNTRYLQDIAGSTTYITLLVEADDITDVNVMNWMYELGENAKKQYEDVIGVTTLSSMLLQFSGNEILTTEQANVNETISNLPK